MTPLLGLLGEAGQQQLQGMQHSARRTRRNTLECKPVLTTVCTSAGMQQHWQEQLKMHLASTK